MNAKRKLLFIVNPISGGTKKKIVLDAIESNIDSAKYDWEISYTSYKGHAKELSLKAVEDKYDVVAAIGGDGTVNEIASTLINTDTALAIIPCGSGNGLARHLHIPLQYTKAVELINRFDVKAIDYGTINERPFFCTCGMGFDAYISAKFDKSLKRGALTYVENAVREVINYKPETYTLINEDGTEMTYKAFCVTFANASQYGNNVYIAPKASMEDGLIDVTVIEPFNYAEAPILAIQFMNGILPSKSTVKMFQARKLTIHREKEDYLHCDGEPFHGGKEVVVEAHPHSLKVVINKNAKIKPITLIQSLSIIFRNKLYANTILGQTISNSSKEILEKIKI